jgi:hypothetical protein
MPPKERGVGYCGAEGRWARAIVRQLITENYDEVIGGTDAIKHVEGCRCCHARIEGSIRRAEEGGHHTVYQDTVEATIQKVKGNNRDFRRIITDFNW